MAVENLRFTHDGFWIQKEGNTCRVGLSVETLKAFGDVSFVDLLDIGEINEGDPFLHVETSKAASELSSPLSGNIRKVNYKILEDAESLSVHDRNNNWIAVFENVVMGDVLNLKEKSLS
ncbi:glycine cleavage system protein H [Oceanobacillus sp. Castelsardo]|uniref:glycine cleavage system protein H n=1 Tax=Oceanobacillus sp. Castelsardo TaxID=1851204 RepID=UPI000837E309|nr:glycine cleavage system protein H [Oceanobacillus sp. Castelsardo]